MRPDFRGSRRGIAIGAAILSVMSLAAACSSSSKSTSPPATTAGSSSPSSATGTGGSPAASGTPFVGAFISTPTTGADNAAGVQAAVKAINAAGGVDGHPIQINECSDGTDVNKATACAQKAVSDSSVVSLVDATGPFGDAYVPTLEKAGLPSLGLLLSTAADDKSPMSFPLNGGTFNTIASAVAAVKLLGFKKIGVPYIGVPAGAQLAPFIKQLVEPLGGSVVGVEAVPITTTDYSALAAKEISANPDVVVDGQTADMFTRFIKSVRQQGSSMNFLISTGVFDATQVKSNFGDDKNIYLVDEYDHSAPGYTAFLHDMDTYNNGYANRNDSVLSGWIGVEAFAQSLKAILASGVSNPTRKDMLAYLNKQTAFDVQGLTGGIDYTKPQTALGGSVPRLFSSKVWLAKANNGKGDPLNGGKPFSLF